MVKFIGGLLVLYGLVGFVLIVFLGFWLLRRGGPLENLRNLLRACGGVLEKSLAMGKKAVDVLKLTLPNLGEVNTGISNVMDKVAQPGEAAAGKLTGLLKDTADFLAGAKDHVRPIKIPVVEKTEEKFPDIKIDMPVITDINFDAVPPEKKVNSFGFEIKDFKIPTLALGEPLVLSPLGDALGNAGEKLKSAREILDMIFTELGNVKSALGENLKALMTFVQEAPNLFFSISTDMLPIIRLAGSEKLVPITALLLLGYLGSVQLAFALTGVALLIV